MWSEIFDEFDREYYKEEIEQKQKELMETESNINNCYNYIKEFKKSKNIFRKINAYFTEFKLKKCCEMLNMNYPRD